MPIIRETNATIVFVLDKSKYTPDKKRLLGNLFFELSKQDGVNMPLDDESRESTVKLVMNGWFLAAGFLGVSMCFQDCEKHSDEHLHPYDKNKIYLMCYGDRDPDCTTYFPISDIKVCQKFVNYFVKNIIETIMPEYAWGDMYPLIAKHGRKDPRQYIWGINYFGEELTTLIGLENILALNATGYWKAEKLKTDGVLLWFQPNPFRANMKKKEQATVRLQLKEKLKAILSTEDEKTLVPFLKIEKDFWEN